MQPHDSSFYHLGLAPKMLQVLEKLKFQTPTPIQHQSIPVALDDKDVVGIAQTGTGKTLAFGIPMVQRLHALGSRGLVLVPTRELAQQVHEALAPILRPFGLKSAVLIGGVPYSRQLQALKKKPRILIATPGRLNDHLEQKNVNLKDVSILVIDEADRMFDMGFAPQVNRILRSVPKNRQCMLFSATMPPEVVRLATRHMSLPIRVEVAPESTTAEGITQELFIVREADKSKVLQKLLRECRGSALVFTETKLEARVVLRALEKEGFAASEIHSNRTMAQRKKAIEGFKSGLYRILVATDVAARGIDISGIELVVNYDLPSEAENYVHRIGRTGRAGLEGRAISLATPDQRVEVARIEHVVKKELPRGSHPDIPTTAFYSVRSRGGRHSHGMGRPR